VKTAKPILIKAITYRVLSYTATALAVYCVTRKAHLALSIGAAESAGKFVLYAVHEAVWRRFV